MYTSFHFSWTPRRPGEGFCRRTRKVSAVSSALEGLCSGGFWEPKRPEIFPGSRVCPLSWQQWLWCLARAAWSGTPRSSWKSPDPAEPTLSPALGLGTGMALVVRWVSLAEAPKTSPATLRPRLAVSSARAAFGSSGRTLLRFCLLVRQAWQPGSRLPEQRAGTISRTRTRRR